MSILSGLIKEKKYKKTSSGYKLVSQWTDSSTVTMPNGKTAETNLGAFQGITDSLTSTSSNIAASAKTVKGLNDSLNACDFITEGSGANTKYYIQKGADTASKKLLGNRAINFSGSFALQTGYSGGSTVSIPLFCMFKQLDISASGGDPTMPITISVTGYRDDGTAVSLGSGSNPSFTKNNIDVHEYKFFTINTYRSGPGLWGWSGSYVLRV